ncbi:hypothetical protein PMPD1_0656 [Paramixta manurensis]|uniref:Negative regulator of flagellin synthesis n=2 Tax=Paramixta manurensis TaxID=2740817 RepID=A0A6M8U4N9_9GAMM|nr:hypothetical protein PMPD1_0656 [Erwiniaceae bacterium PD-1]
MKIDASPVTASRLSLSTSQENPGIASSTRATTPISRNEPETQSSMMLNDAKAELKTLSEVDNDKVNALKTAIREGNYPVDCEQLSHAMREFFAR